MYTNVNFAPIITNYTYIADAEGKPRLLGELIDFHYLFNRIILFALPLFAECKYRLRASPDRRSAL